MRILNSFLIMILLGAGFALYSLEYETRQSLFKIAQIKTEISQEQERIHNLTLEWSSLTDPQRLETLAREHLKLEPLSPQQIVSLETVASKLPDVSPDSLPSGFVAQDPISDMLKNIP